MEDFRFAGVFDVPSRGGGSRAGRARLRPTARLRTNSIPNQGKGGGAMVFGDATTLWGCAAVVRPRRGITMKPVR